MSIVDVVNSVLTRIKQAVAVSRAPNAASPWANGWWRFAVRKPAHPGRVGGIIRPFAVVVHDTDMLPRDFDALVKSWTTKAALGDCAHFLIASDGGVVQFVPIDMNANHAGGPVGAHGWYLVDGKRVHPNSATIGIELHTAGQVRRVAGQWRWGEGSPWVPIGPALPDDECTADATHAGVGWHGPTVAQLSTLEHLLADLELVLLPMPANTTTEPHGVGVSWLKSASARIVGHVTLDPGNKTDPGPRVMSWLRSR